MKNKAEMVSRRLAEQHRNEVTVHFEYGDPTLHAARGDCELRELDLTEWTELLAKLIDWVLSPSLVRVSCTGLAGSQSGP